MSSRLIPVLMGTLALAAYCQTAETYRNYSGEKKPLEITVLRQRGYKFWLVEDRKKAADELRLVPGEYMVGFVTAAREGGAALCALEPGKVYSFKVIERQYLPRTGTYALVGQCFFEPERKDNKPE